MSSKAVVHEVPIHSSFNFQKFQRMLPPANFNESHQVQTPEMSDKRATESFGKGPICQVNNLTRLEPLLSK